MQNMLDNRMGVAPGRGEPVSIAWVKPIGLIGLSIINFLLIMVTLGIYQFWGKTEVRKRIWSAIRIQGEPMQYTGTGLELFLGFLIAFGLIVLPFILAVVGAAVAFGPESVAYQIVIITFYVALAYLIGVGTYRAMRYRMSRTRWRGIVGGVDGNSFAYGWTYFWTLLLIPFTLGWIIPWRSVKLQGALVNNMRFGDRYLSFAAPSGPLYVPFAVLWVGAIALYSALIGGMLLIMQPGIEESLEIGVEYVPQPAEILMITGLVLAFIVLVTLVSAWYSARMINHFAAHTHFEGATFRATTTAPSLIWLSLTNFLIVFLTLGLLTPVAQARSTGYLIQRLSLEGLVPLEEIVQGAMAKGGFGEGVAQAFDVDAF